MNIMVSKTKKTSQSPFMTFWEIRANSVKYPRANELMEQHFENAYTHTITQLAATYHIESELAFMLYPLEDAHDLKIWMPGLLPTTQFELADLHAPADVNAFEWYLRQQLAKAIENPLYDAIQADRIFDYDEERYEEFEDWENELGYGDAPENEEDDQEGSDLEEFNEPYERVQPDWTIWERV